MPKSRSESVNAGSCDVATCRPVSTARVRRAAHRASQRVEHHDASTADIRGCEFAAGAGVIPSARTDTRSRVPNAGSQHDVAIGCVANSEAARGEQIVTATDEQQLFAAEVQRRLRGPGIGSDRWRRRITGSRLASCSELLLRSKRYTCGKHTSAHGGSVAPGIRLLAVDTNATKRPLPDNAELVESPVAPVATVEMAMTVPGASATVSSAGSRAMPRPVSGGGAIPDVDVGGGKPPQRPIPHWARPHRRLRRMKASTLPSALIVGSR